MIVNFHLNYGTIPGEYIGIHLKKGKKEKTLRFQSYDRVNWHGVVEVAESEEITYKYFLQTAKGEVSEHGEYRRLLIPKGQALVYYQDFWRPQYEVERSFFSAAFKDVIFRRNQAAVRAAPAKPVKNNAIVFQLYAAAIPQHLQFCLLGNCDALGNWETPLLMSDANFPTWQAEIGWTEPLADIEFKFAAYDPQKKRIVDWETGENRRLQFTFPTEKRTTLVHAAESFRYPPPTWRGAGLAIPVFSLRSNEGCGIGEFNDLKLLVDWAVKTGMKLVQTLPVNDTIATKTWTDSYPYAAISVFALHPLYINLPDIARLKDRKTEARLQAAAARLNECDTVDFEGVLKTKFEFLSLLYEQEKTAFFKNKDAQDFIEKNADWLKPYAAFCHLRDLNGTTNFNTWKKYAAYSAQVIADLCHPGYEAFDQVAFYYFVQYHAHRQLSGATEYARRHGVVLKGDLPIGIYRESCDAWVAPDLYNMDGQAGAPPDPYAEAGQNWGFPTYNWEVMAKDGFEWWRQRMTKLAEYFDALRIDHILGFFRIWQIPTNQVEGTLGLFNPRLPYTRQELAAFGLTGNLVRYTTPYIREHFLEEMFGQDAAFVRREFLEQTAPQAYRLKKSVDDQLKIRKLFSTDKRFAKYKHLEKGLMRLVANVLLLPETLPGGGTGFNPRITLSTTRSFKELDKAEQLIFTNLYDDYYYKRHDEFWKQQALWKLPPLLSATNMLICGEDLGMIPKPVPEVMRELNILSLEIQRMPKGQTEFEDPATYPYTSVCSPSCHDMSTIRGWWEEDPERSQRFFEKMLRQQGEAPKICTPGIVAAINQQHLDSPSMWAIFPLQDLVGMDEHLRRPRATDEQINDPSVTPHFWRFRFHLPFGRLLEAESLSEKIKQMVKAAGR